MREQFSQMANRLEQLPRAVRWGLYAAVALILFLVWYDHINPATESIRRQAAAIERDRDRVRNTADLYRDIEKLVNTVRTVGNVATPRDNVEGERFDNAVTEVLKKHSVRSEQFTLRRGGAFQSEPLRVVTGDRQTQRMVGELRFEATPDVVIAIIASLESRPEIAALRQVHLNRASGGRLSVFISLEAWILPTDGVQEEQARDV